MITPLVGSRSGYLWNWYEHPGAIANILIDTSGENVAFTGPIWMASTAATIERIHFGFGTCTASTVLSMTVSMRSISTVAPPMQPDETVDQFLTVLSTDIAAKHPYRSSTFDAARTVQFGERLSVVFEPDGWSTAGTDRINLRVGNFITYVSVVESRSSASTAWTVQSYAPSLVFEFTDGTYGTLFDALPCIPSLGSLSGNVSSTSSQNTRGAFYYTSVPVKIMGMRWRWTPTTAASIEVHAADSCGNALASVTWEAFRNTTYGSQQSICLFPTPFFMLPGNKYYFMLTALSTATWQHMIISGSSDFLAFCADGGYAAGATASTSWSDISTSLSAIWPIVEAVENESVPQFLMGI